MKKLFTQEVTISDVDDAVDRRRIDREWEKSNKELHREFETKNKLNVYLRTNPVDSFPQEVKVTEDRHGKPVLGYLSLWITTKYGFHVETRLVRNRSEAESETAKAKDLIASWPQTAYEPSKSFSLAPIVSAFKKAEKEVPTTQKWIGANDEAREILAFVEKFRENVNGLNREEMEALISNNVAKVNSFLTSHGFDLRIEQLADGSTFMAAVMKIIVKWLKKGEATVIKAKDGNKYSGVAMTDQTLFTVMTGAPQGILVLNTQSKDKDRVYITIHPEAPESGFEAWKLCLDLMNKTDKAAMPAEEWEIKFPMIDFKAEEEIPLAGTMDETKPLPWIVLQSKMQNIFQMDEAGAIAKSAFVAEMIPASIGWTSERARLTIDEPCLIWIERENVPFPVFAGWFNYGEWNDPKDR